MRHLYSVAKLGNLSPIGRFLILICDQKFKLVIFKVWQTRQTRQISFLFVKFKQKGHKYCNTKKTKKEKWRLFGLLQSTALATLDIGFFDLIRCFCNQIRFFCNQFRFAKTFIYISLYRVTQQGLYTYIRNMGSLY